MARDGRVVIRPDSGDPVDIICGLRTNPHFNTRMKEGKYYCCYAPFNDDAEYVEVSEGQYYGAYYMLGKIFGWNTTSKDYRYPSTKVGLLYGDSITLERQKQIYLRLENAHMAACNLVLGVEQTICMRLGIANITSNTLSAPNISSSIFSKSKKPYYNILLDDRAGLEESYEILKYVVDEIKLNQQGNQ